MATREDLDIINKDLAVFEAEYKMKGLKTSRKRELDDILDRMYELKQKIMIDLMLNEVD